MSLTRRSFIKQSSAWAAAATAAFPQSKNLLDRIDGNPPSIKPPRLRRGNTVGLITPGFQVTASQVDDSVAKFTEMGLRTKLGKHVLDEYGYLGGQDRDRAEDVNAMFADPEVDAIIATRGGWGCNRILEYLDYETIKRNPKIIMGYSDVTSLLNAIYAKTGVVTFHGPVGIATWNAFTKEYVRDVLFDGRAKLMDNRNPLNNDQPTVRTIYSGQARGVLIGGNLSVLVAMVGSPYLPDFKDKILFLEEVSEEVYRVDRMLTQLRTAGLLSQLKGFVFGNCKDCSPGMSPSLSLMEVLYDHIAPLGIPAWYGSMIGHISNKFTVPVGINVEINASTGTIQMLESAVI